MKSFLVSKDDFLKLYPDGKKVLSSTSMKYGKDAI